MEPAKAKDLYLGPIKHLFKLAELLDASCFVLSAKYGLVDCEEFIEPYDVYLGNLSKREVDELKARVKRRCDLLRGPWELVVMHLSARYASILDCEIITRKALVVGTPPRGLRAEVLRIVKYRTMGERGKLLASLGELLSQL